MNKKLLLIILMLTLFVSGNIFAQTDFSASAKSRATGGEFTSDSDKVNAKDIFDIKRTFFSAGYMPTLTSGGVYDGEATASANAGTMNGFWAMPIGKTMMIGLAGEYKMYATKTDASTASDNRAEVYNENSAFNIRPVFQWNNIAFHYRIFRSGSSVTETTTTSSLDSKIVTDGALWEHEIGFAYKAKAFTIYVPVGAIIDMNRSTTKWTNTSIDQSVNSTVQNEVGSVAIYFNPEVVIPLKRGPLTQFKVGLEAKFDVYNSGEYTEAVYTNTTSGLTTTHTIEYEDLSASDFNLYFTPTLEWNVSKGKIDFALEPTIGLMYAHTNLGTYSTTTDGEVSLNQDVKGYVNYATPYFDIVIGSLVRPIEWFEIRASLHYGIYWQNIIETTGYSIQDGGYSGSSYKFLSEFNVCTGFGFILDDDLFIDVYIQAGKSSEELANGYISSSSGSGDLFEITAYGAQFSYRF